MDPDYSIQKAISDAHVNRAYTPHGDVTPSLEELDALSKRVEQENTEGTTGGFLDAQAEFIDALLIALESSLVSA
jgi:hypothetical protein